MPAKTQPDMNQPLIGVTTEDPGKCVLGSVPVEADGSAHFRVPSGVAVFFQALDDRGRAVQTMRSLTYVQPGQTLSCIGCHESRTRTPPSRELSMASRRAPSKLTPSPSGSWPLRFDELVQPVLDKHCTACHRADGPDPGAAKLALTAEKAWENMVNYGKPSLSDTVKRPHDEGRSIPHAGPSHTSALLMLLEKKDGHYKVQLSGDNYERLVTWMDTYAQARDRSVPSRSRNCGSSGRRWRR